MASRDSLPGVLSRAKRAESLLASWRKRIEGRQVSLREITRVAREIGPLVQEAAQQPTATARLAAIAEARGQREESVRAEWAALEEADLLLEAGGDPDAISSAGAVGVAQWMADTGRAQGLKVDLAVSRRLSAKITALRWRLAWIAYLQRPDADRNAPDTPAFSSVEMAQTPALQQELDALEAKRRLADERYDARKAIFAQTRYLLGLYARFPSFDWLFQAYHGGEGGVKRLLREYTGLTSPLQAIQRGDGGKPLSYEALYFGCTPRRHLAAFSYLYGRGDDHRHYWWKLRASRLALARYRQDPAAFQKQWEAYLPGRREEAFWYPTAPEAELPDLPSLQAALSKHILLPVTDTPELHVRPAPLDPANAPSYATLRPEAKGTLLLIAALYRQAGMTAPLAIGDLTLTAPLVAQKRLLFPPKPLPLPLWPPGPDAKILPGGGPPADFDFHTTGLAFDILRPADAKQRKTLEYVLDGCAERQIFSVTEAKTEGERRYHIVPNPLYAKPLAQLGTQAKRPTLSF